MKGITAVLITGLLVGIFFFIRIVQKNNQSAQQKAKVGNGEQPVNVQLMEEKMTKTDDNQLEELRYVSGRETQAGNEISNIFYMYILIITIVGGVVSQLIADHLAAKTSKPELAITPTAIDAVACILLTAAFIFSLVCFRAYFDTAKSQLCFSKKRAKIKYNYDKDNYDKDSHAFQDLLDTIGKKDVSQMVPSYIRFVTISSASVCLGGCLTIGSGAIVFLITPPPLHELPWAYYKTLIIISITTAVCIAALIWYVCKNRSPSKAELQTDIPCLIVLFLACVGACYLVPLIPLAPQDALLAFEIYSLAGLIGLFTLVSTYLSLMLYTFKRVGKLEAAKKENVDKLKALNPTHLNPSVQNPNTPTP